MTRTEFIDFLEAHGVPQNAKTRLASCKAWYEDCEDYVILRSYDTNVACFVKRTGTLIVRDRYSATTTCHVNHFLNEMEVKYGVMRVTYLYKRSDRVIELGWGNRANTYKLTKAEFEKVKANDFAGYIPTLTVNI